MLFSTERVKSLPKSRVVVATERSSAAGTSARFLFPCHLLLEKVLQWMAQPLSVACIPTISNVKDTLVEKNIAMECAPLHAGQPEKRAAKH